MKDGAIFADTGHSGFGYVVRDDVGMFVTAGSGGWICGQGYDPKIADADGLSKVLLWLLDHRFTR